MVESQIGDSRVVSKANKPYFSYLFGIFAIILLIVVIWLIVYSNSQGRQCLKNPYVYGASKMKKVECQCQQWTNPLCPANFWFNDSTFISQPTKCNVPMYNVQMKGGRNK